MSPPPAIFQDPRSRRAFFVGVDSDGSVFDTMEVKNKRCFIPAMIRCWGLQSVSELARETAEFVWLHSRWRGANRFTGLLLTLDLLARRPGAAKRGFVPPNVRALRDWCNRGTALCSETLRREVERNPDLALRTALEWSDACNQAVEQIVRHVPPFANARPCLERLSAVADVVVVSAASHDALERDWAQDGLVGYTRMLCGQEMGAKDEHIRQAAGGKYEGDHILMIGDAPGDMRAAKLNGGLFFPINPGAEAGSWKRLLDEGIDRFLSGTFRGPYEDNLVAEFNKLLPSIPPWER